MKSTFFARRALTVLVILAFLAPFSVRGARLALEGMKNNVKDWLPNDYPETTELDWFREHFISEQFIIASWDDCYEGSQELEVLLAKLSRWTEHADLIFHDTEASRDHLGIGGEASAEADGEDPAAETLTKADRYALQVGWDERLFIPDDYHENWGGREERWLLGKGDRWYFITPSGEIFRWTGNDTPFGMLYRKLSLLITGEFVTPGEPIATVDPKYYDDPRLLCAPLFKRVVTGSDLLEQLTQPGGPLVRENDNEAARSHAYDTAYERLDGIVFGPALPGPDGVLGTDDDPKSAGPDGLLGTEDDKPRHRTCVLVTLTPAAGEYLERVVGRGMLGKPTGILYRLADESGIIPNLDDPDNLEKLKLGGPPCDNVAIDEEGTITLFNLVGWSVLLGFALSYFCFRSVRVTLMVFTVGGLSAISSMALVWWMGSSLDAILMSMPSLIYVLGLSGAVHIVNYYRDAVEHQGLSGAPETALRHGWGPCTLAAFTTAIGLLSLNTSHLIPIEKFGTFSAIGVVASLVMLFAFLPAALQLWPPSNVKKLAEADADAKPTGEARVQMLLTNFWKRIGVVSVRHSGWVCAGGLAAIVLCAIGLTRINTSVQLIKLFDQDAKLIHDYTWLEEHLGNLVPVEVVLKINPESSLRTAQHGDDAPVDERGRAPFEDRSKLRFVDELRLTSSVHTALEREFGPEGHNVSGKAMSVAAFSPPMLEPGSTLEGGLNRTLEASVQQFIETDYLRYDLDDHASLWRVSLRLGALNDVDYGQFVSELERVVEPIVGAYNRRVDVLRAVETSRPERGFSGGQVLVLGAPNYEARHQQVEGDSQTPMVTTVAATTTTPAEHRIDQDRLFSEALIESLQVARVGVYPHDPQVQPLTEEYLTSQQWAATLAKADAVVLLEGEGYNVDFLREQLGDKLVDLTHHRFAAGDPTARAAEEPISAVYTGIVPIVYKAQRELLESLVWSVATAFLLIAGVMMVLLRGVRAGLISMIPNVFPVVLVFGLMGWSDIIVDIGSMMTASVAMGIAVDDTIHFLTWFRRGLDEGYDRRGAIMQAYDRCAAAMTETTLIGGLGLAVFAFSTFTPTQRFGVLMLALLCAALIGDLVLMPALLASPLGNVFKPRKPKGPQAEGDSEPSTDLPAGTPALAADGVVAASTPHSKHSSSRARLRTDQPHPGPGH